MCGSGGYIKVYRQMREEWLWRDEEPFDRRSAWLDLLMDANYTDQKRLIGMQLVSIGRGQLVTSTRTLAIRWHWNKDRVVKFLALLESDGMITKSSDNKRTVITICNYDKYQIGKAGAVTSDTFQTQTGHFPDTDPDTTQTLLRQLPDTEKACKTNVFSGFTEDSSDSDADIFQTQTGHFPDTDPDTTQTQDGHGPDTYISILNNIDIKEEGKEGKERKEEKKKKEKDICSSSNDDECQSSQTDEEARACVREDTKGLERVKGEEVQRIPAEFADIVEAWNTLADYGISTVHGIGPDTQRARMLRVRIRENGKGEVLKAIDNIRSSPFLQGHNNTGWLITFDWFVKPGNFMKVLEGNYNARSGTNSKTTGYGGTPSMFAEVDGWVESAT